MKEIVRHRSEMFRKTGISFVLVMVLMVLAAGCGKNNTQKDAVSQENQNGRQEEPSTEDGQESGQSTDSQQPDNNRQSDDGQQNSQQTAGQPAHNENHAGTVNQPKLSPEEAKEAALQHAGVAAEEATVIKNELDYDDGKTEYEIEFVAGGTKYEYEISADDGAVLGSSQEPVEELPQNLQTQGIISVEEAKEAVLSHAGFTPEQVTYTKVELEQDDGVTEYEIKFYAEGKEYSGKVNGATGAILEYEME